MFMVRCLLAPKQAMRSWESWDRLYRGLEGVLNVSSRLDHAAT